MSKQEIDASGLGRQVVLQLVTRRIDIGFERIAAAQEVYALIRRVQRGET